MQSMISFPGSCTGKDKTLSQKIHRVLLFMLTSDFFFFFSFSFSFVVVVVLKELDGPYQYFCIIRRGWSR